MMKKLLIEFEADWVLSHREDDCLPVDAICKALEGMTEIKVEGNSLTDIFVVFDEQTVQADELQKKIKEVIASKFPQDDLNSVFRFKLVSEQAGGEKDVQDEPEKGDSEAEQAEDEEIAQHRAKARELASSLKEELNGGNKLQDIADKIDGLVGAQAFKDLANELVLISPETKKRKLGDLFAYQSYLFAIGDGCGFTTYLELLAQLLSATGMQKMRQKFSVIEEKLPNASDGPNAFNSIYSMLQVGSPEAMKVLGLDISEWMSNLNSPVLRNFLREAEKSSDGFIIVFRVPFVDKEVLAKVEGALNDILCIRTLEFPPMSEDEIKSCAKSELQKYGYKVSAPAWGYFLKRIAEEKSDGRFYGFNTVKKVIVEMLYKKLLHNASKQISSDVIGKKDTMCLCRAESDSELSGYEMLNKLVGNENIKKSIEEIIAQIEFSMQNDSKDRPCIHMRFEGNPGTGKTTVARIIGKILKEKGILRNGNFYEYGGRDFCGRYVGETAPKTSSICRDAYGSVLFIDEAYSLYRSDSSDRDYGREALDTLIAEMENHRNDLVVIMAGYKDDMNVLMKGNLGLASRMPYIIEFPNFTREQLYEIFVSMVKDKFKYEEKLFEEAHKYFLGLTDDILNAKEFSNARFVRNLFERTWAKASLRCQLDKQKTVVLTASDFERASKEKEFKTIIPKKARIGF